MIPEPATKTNRPEGSLGMRLMKKAVSFLPDGAPSKIYNAALKIPVARDILGAAVRSTIPESISVNGCTIFLDRSDMAVSGSLVLKGFESYETDIFKQAVKAGMNVVDIGAHIGYYSLMASKAVGTTGRVFSFEPEPTNLALLRKNIGVNSASNVTTIGAAASDSTGTRDLFIEKYNKGHHSFGQGAASSGKTTVKTTTLDESMRSFGSPKIDVLKIDIEGAEPIALRGMKETIARSPDLVIFTEVYPRCMIKLGESPTKYLEELKSLGFLLWHIDEENQAVKPIKDISIFISEIPDGEAFVNVIASKA